MAQEHGREIRERERREIDGEREKTLKSKTCNRRPREERPVRAREVWRERIEVKYWRRDAPA